MKKKPAHALSKSEAPGGPYLRKTLIWCGTLITLFGSAVVSGLGNDVASAIRSFIPRSSNPALSATVEADPRFLAAQAWLLPSGFPASRLKPDYEGIGIWAPRLEARPAGSMALKVSITAQIPGGLIIIGIQANVVKRSPLTPHVLADNPGQGGGIPRNTAIGLNLDEDEPSAALFPDGQVGDTAAILSGSYFSKYSVDLPYRATHIFEVVAYATKADDQWVLRIDYVAKGKDGHLVVTENGHPFRLAGYSGNSIFSAIYIPGYIAYPPDYKHTWTKVGQQLCPKYYRPC
jgi:hypothetical protein